MAGKKLPDDQRQGYGATYEDLAEEINRVSYHVARDYPDIDWEDVRQQLALFVLENGKSIKLKEHGGNPRRLLTLVANEFCKDQRTQHMSLSPQYAYRPSDVMLILETAYSGDPMSSYVPDDARHPLSGTFNVWDDQGGWKSVKADPFHFIDAVEVASDVKAVLRQLKPELREAIFDRYVQKIIPDNNSYARKKFNKAINELTRKLNWYRGVPDRRRAMSNTAAQAVLSNTYEG